MTQVMCGEEVQSVMYRCNVVCDSGVSTNDDIVHVDMDDRAV